MLVRPELALIGGLALIMMLVAARGWRRRVLIVVAGGLLPVAYQIFRMGYYGLLVPQTALAKDASGDKWAQGWVYLTNFDEPYLLWVPALLLAVLAVVLLVTRSRPWWIRRTTPYGYGRLARMVQSPAAVVMFIVVSGLLQARLLDPAGRRLHARQGSADADVLPAGARRGDTRAAARRRKVQPRSAGYQLAGITSVLWLAVVGWSLWAANSPGMGPDATRVTYTGIVDERRFYSQATGHAHPLTAADYLDYPRMRAVLVALNNTPDGALLLPSGNFDRWDVVPAIPPPPGMPPELRKAYIGPAHSVFHQPRHARHERRSRRPGDRPDRARQSAGRSHRASGGRPHRPRQEPLPRLGRRRGTVFEEAALHSAVPRPGLDRPGRGGTEVPGHRIRC